VKETNICDRLAVNRSRRGLKAVMAMIEAPRLEGAKNNHGEIRVEV
jgi:hypothetical protein